jgi:restriction system protein
LQAGAGDEGIDGVCSFDRLGLINVKFKAKRYAENHHISRETLSSFVGSLDERGYGVFVTTSDYTREAKEWLGHRSERIKLINGEELARIMAETGLGVRKKTIEIADDIDEDYFSDLI